MAENNLLIPRFMIFAGLTFGGTSLLIDTLTQPIQSNAYPFYSNSLQSHYLNLILDDQAIPIGRRQFRPKEGAYYFSPLFDTATGLTAIQDHANNSIRYGSGIPKKELPDAWLEAVSSTGIYYVNSDNLDLVNKFDINTGQSYPVFTPDEVVGFLNAKGEYVILNDFASSPNDQLLANIFVDDKDYLIYKNNDGQLQVIIEITQNIVMSISDDYIAWASGNINSTINLFQQNTGQEIQIPIDASYPLWGISIRDTTILVSSTDNNGYPVILKGEAHDNYQFIEIAVDVGIPNLR